MDLFGDTAFIALDVLWKSSRQRTSRHRKNTEVIHTGVLALG